MRKPIIIVSILLMCSMVLSSTTLIFGNFASAATGAANFLPNVSYTWPNGFDTAYEMQISTSVAQDITGYMANKYPTSYFNAYGSQANLVNYQSVVSYLQNYDKAVIYSKGHRGGLNGNSSISLITNEGTATPNTKNFFDNDIYARTSSKNVVTFIWHCETARYYPQGANPSNPYGMPYAFTKNPSMAKYGTTGAQVYLGWENKQSLLVYNFTTNQYNYITNPAGGSVVGSPQYEWGIKPYFDYSHIAKNFWNHMSQGDSVQEALNKLSTSIYGQTNFLNSDLKDWLIVYGNMYNRLP